MATNPTPQARQLQLLLALDAVRDTFGDDQHPEAMFESIAELLRDEFTADACAILLLAETPDEVETITACGMSSESALQLCRRAARRKKAGIARSAEWAQALAIAVTLDGRRLGGLVLARQSEPFSKDEIELLRLAENQIDSAILQAKSTYRLIQRNRQLQALHEIDTLRDETADEAELISGFTTIVRNHFEASLCLVLVNPAGGQSTIRSLIDQHKLSAQTLSAIRSRTHRIKKAQLIGSPRSIKSLTLLAAPFKIEGKAAGAIVVGREAVFEPADHKLLELISSQIDNAIVHSRLAQQLAIRNKELEVIYRIDHIRDTEKDFETMLQQALTELCQAVTAELGYVMLYSEANEDQLTLMSSTESQLLTTPAYHNAIKRVSRKTLKAAQLTYSNDGKDPVRSIMATPLILNERIIGVFGVVNSLHAHGFDPQDREILSAITSQIDTAVFERLERRRMRKVLSRSVDIKVLEHILRDANASILSGKRFDLTVLFADLRGSTEWGERIEPELLVSTMNTFLDHMTKIIFKHNGTLDKFVGDQVIGLFGTPVPDNNHAAQAARAALEMQAVQKRLQSQLAKKGHELPSMGIGLSTGEAIAGEIGASSRTDFTAMGRIVNLGARLCGAAAADQILISEATYATLQPRAVVKALPPLDLKGISQPAPVYALHKLKGK